MSLFYSAAASGFFDDEIHSKIPDDARPISRERHALLMDQQGQGSIIVADEKGDAIAVAPPPASPEARLAAVREERDKLLRASDYTQMPDLQISPEMRAEWATYRQALRDLPALIDYLDAIEWPTPPEQ